MSKHEFAVEAHGQAVDKLSVKEYEDPFIRNSSKKK